MKEKLLVSACLVGKNTKYNGGNNYNAQIDTIKEKYDFVLICPEMEGGLPCPRDPSEIVGEKVIMITKKDVTKEYHLGAQIALEKAIKHGCKKALLKEKSPSCGTHKIYDGTFSGTLIDGMGVTAKLLKDNGILVYSENEIKNL